MKWQDRLSSKRHYIIPTRYGVMLLLLTSSLFFAGALLGNRLASMSAFVLLSISIATMVRTNQHLSRLKFKSVVIPIAKAGTVTNITYSMENLSGEKRAGINVETMLNGVDQPRRIQSRIPPQGRVMVWTMTLPPLNRGVYTLKGLKISTTFPIGAFYAWKLVHNEKEIFVAPAPYGVQALPEPEGSGDEGTQLSFRGGDEFVGYRPFVTGDNPRHIDWRIYARVGTQQIKTFSQNRHHALHFNHVQVEGIEAKLSQLSAWLHMCHTRGDSYSLLLPHVSVGPSSGEQHFSKCLMHLATYPAEPINDA